MKIAKLYEMSKLISVSILIGNPPLVYHIVSIDFARLEKIGSNNVNNITQNILLVFFILGNR